MSQSRTSHRSDGPEVLITTSEVARRLGISRQLVRSLALLHGDSPESVGKIGNSIVWRLSELEQRATATGRNLTRPK